jgi:hypothetical protein
MRRLRIAFVVVLFSLGLLFASGPASAASTSRATNTAQRPTPSDAEISATIRTKLAKSKIGKDGFRFHVQHGIVTWDGSTNVVQHKGAATRMAKSAGAIQVVNNIQISASGKAKSVASLKRASIVQ